MSWVDLLHQSGAVGAGLVAGIFFAFSTFIMRALARVPAAEGVRAMQAINITVITPLFLGLFMGMALLSLAGLAHFIVDAEGRSVLGLAAACCYLLGTFSVTIVGNIPLNERLAKVDAESSEGQALWQHYLRVWTHWNHVRTIMPTAAMVMWILA